MIRIVDKEINDWGLEAMDVERAVIEECNVTQVELIDVVSFGPNSKGNRILVVGSSEITTTVSYTHPNWDEAIYDSEDKVLIPFDSVEGETEIILTAEFSMSILVDKKSNPEKIEDFQFRNDDFVFIDLYPYDPYE